MPLRDGAKAFRAAVKSMVNVEDGLFVPVIRTSDSAMMRRRQKAWPQVDQCEYRRGRQAIKHLQSRKGSAPGIGRPDPLPPFACLGLRSEERRVGKGGVSTCRSRGSPDHKKK